MAKINWSLDPMHSEINFKVKHMMISNVTGTFKEFSLSASSDEEDFTKSEVSFSAKVKSIDTKNEQRDEHLRSADFFETEKYPEITFHSTGIKKIESDGSFELDGDLTIKGVKKPLKLKGEFGGIQKDPWGNTKAGFTVEGKINRKDFGLNWNAALETGGVLVGEDIKISAEIELAKA